MGGYRLYTLEVTINLLLTGNYDIFPFISAVFAGMFIAQLSIVSHIFVAAQLL